MAVLCSAQNSNTSFKKTIEKLNNKAISIARKNQDSAYYYLEKSISNSKRENHWAYVMDAYFEIYNIAFYHNNFDKRKSTLKTLDSLYKSQEHYYESLENKYRYTNHINYYYGFYYYRLNNYNLSKKYFQKIIDATENTADSILLKNKSFLSVAYSYIAKMNTDEGKYELSKALYKNNIRLLKKIDSTNTNLIYSNFNLLAEVLKKEKKHKESNVYFLKSLHYYNSKDSPNTIMSSCFNIAKNYIELSKIDSAKFYLNIAKKHLDKDHLYNTNYHKLFSRIYSEQNKYSEALAELNKTLVFYKNKVTRTSKKNQYLAVAHSNIGELHQKFNKPSLALDKYNIAIQLFKNDSVKSSINQIHLLKTLKLKAKTLNNINNYKETIEIVDYAITILDDLKPSFKNNNDKLFLIENAFPLFESGIKASYQLHIKEKDKTYIEKTFFYAEKSKSVLLLEALLSSKATKYANIPENIIEEEELLKYEITRLEKKINSNKTEALEDKLFNLKLKHRSFIEKLEIDYKNYYNLKYNSQGASLLNTQKILSKKETLISFFYGEQDLYTIVVSKKEKQLIKMPLSTSFKNTLKSSYKMLSNPKSELSDLNNKLKILHKNIFAPILSTRHDLIIVPDGLLNYIPFSAFIDDSSQYLIENHTISYINSATLLQQLQNKKENNGDLLAFAPSFNNNSKLLPLPNNKKEAENCSSYFNGKVFENDSASLINFNTKSSNYSIIHLATHSVFNDESPEFSFLAFTPNKDRENLLYTKDLYNLKINADLVTLSACESGIGELRRGEGLLSLARGFYFSGANSIASTLWKVNDASSAKLMDDFYKALAEKENKNSALKTAQLNFIKENRDNKLSHPYYWSGFIISGNTNPINDESFLLYILGGVLMLMLLYFYFRRKNV